MGKAKTCHSYVPWSWGNVVVYGYNDDISSLGLTSKIIYDIVLERIGMYLQQILRIIQDQINCINIRSYFLENVTLFWDADRDVSKQSFYLSSNGVLICTCNCCFQKNKRIHLHEHHGGFMHKHRQIV